MNSEKPNTDAVIFTQFTKCSILMLRDLHAHTRPLHTEHWIVPIMNDTCVYGMEIKSAKEKWT